jgi:DNA-binding beta-propeller fold protein YncE
MMRIPLTALVLSAAFAVTALAADPSYRIVERFKMPDGGWDYATADAATHRIYWARTDFTDVIDTATGKLSQLKSANNGHMAVPVVGTTLVVLPMRVPAKTARIADTATDTVVADLPAGDSPDGATYDPFSKHVFVVNHRGSDVTEVDPVAHKIAATIPVGGGKLEFAAADGTGHVFVNIQEAGVVAVIDVKAQKVSAHYKMAGCEDASGLAYADKSKLLIASCGNGLAKVLAADTGKEVASIPIGLGPDSVIYDPVRQIAFIPCGKDGTLEIISVADPAHIAKIQTLKTQVLARTGAVDRQTGRLYMMAAMPDPSKPLGGGGRPTPKDGSFEMLVIAP